MDNFILALIMAAILIMLSANFAGGHSKDVAQQVVRCEQISQQTLR